MTVTISSINTAKPAISIRSLTRMLKSRREMLSSARMALSGAGFLARPGALPTIALKYRARPRSSRSSPM